MAHSCPTCNQACYCDGEDTWMDSESDNCTHDCDPVDLKDEYQEEGW